MSKKAGREKELDCGLGYWYQQNCSVWLERLTMKQKIEVIGFGSHPSRGLKRGVVVNIESTVQAISARYRRS